MMSEFDTRARDWDNDQRHIDRSVAIAAAMRKSLHFSRGMKALEYGAGTGLLSFLLKDLFEAIVLMDNSREMIRVCEEKVVYYDTQHIRPLWFDLEHHDYEEKFDIIYNQMVLHHVHDADSLLSKFHDMLNPEGILVVADLYKEDGSFHGHEVDVHQGFDPEQLIKDLENKGFKKGSYTPCFNVKRPNGREYPVFLLWVVKSND